MIYDWGYLTALGLSFSSLPTSLSDHLRSALNWLPGAIAYMALGVIFELVTRRIEGGKSDRELIASSKHPKIARIFRVGPDKAIVLLSEMAIVLWVMLGDQFRDGLWVLIPIVWLNFSAWVIAHPGIRARTSRAVLLAFAFAPAAAASVYFLGDKTARADVKDREAPAVVIAGAKSSHDGGCLLVRTFESVAIVRDATGDVSVIRTADISSIMPRANSPYRGVLCMVWVRARACDAYGGAVTVNQAARRVNSKQVLAIIWSYWLATLGSNQWPLSCERPGR